MLAIHSWTVYYHLLTCFGGISCMSNRKKYHTQIVDYGGYNGGAVVAAAAASIFFWRIFDAE